MFWPDVIALKEFYASPLGQMACLAVRRRLRAAWPEVRGDRILGIGFATPYLTPFLENAQRVYACMPASQGVIHWPAEGGNLAFLSDEAELPFDDHSLARVLLVHAVENSERLRAMMSEIWRVLSPTGRLLAVVPNRRGIWARSPASPFAHGQPFSSWQLRELLREHSFTPLTGGTALFFAPTARQFLLRSARVFESFGGRFFPAFGGVIIMEAEKQIYAPAARRIVPRAVRSYNPLAQPAGIKQF